MFFLSALPFNPLVLLSGITIHMLLGMIWYSPVAFGPLWTEYRKTSAKKLKMHAGHLVGAALVGLTLTLCLSHLSSVLHIECYRTAIESGLILWLGLVATSQFSAVIWQGKIIPLFLIEAGFWAVDICAIMAMITSF
jgi:hypothetical protein